MNINHDGGSSEDESACLAVEAFISYSRVDSSKAELVSQALQTAGVTVWLDRRSIEAGGSWVSSIFKGLETADFVVVLLSANATASQWVRKETETALAYSLSGSGQVLIPVLLEDIEIPTLFKTLQIIDLTKDFESGLARLVARVASRVDRQVHSRDQETDVVNQPSVLVRAVRELQRSMRVLFRQSRGSSLGPRARDLHRHLLRLEAVVHEIGSLSLEAAEAMWSTAGVMMPGPIPGPDAVLHRIDVAIIHETSGISHMDALRGSDVYRLLLLRKYLSVMRDLGVSLRAGLNEALVLQSPDVADAIERLWRVKISINRAIKSTQAVRPELGGEILQNHEVIGYIEAARTLESRGLLQLIDADAREVSNDAEMGVTVLGEIVRFRAELLHDLSLARRGLGRLLARQAASGAD